MAEKIVLETEIKTGNSTNSVKGLKNELRELTKQLGTLEQGSQAFNDAAKRAGQLKEQIRGIADAIDDADPEKAFGPFSRTVAGLAGGFSAAQGAMALFGSESEELEKTLVRVQGAMALSQGINSLLEFRNDFKEFGGIIVNNVVKAFTTLRGAIMATGLGLLAVTVGVLVTNWKEFTKAIEEAFPGFAKVTNFFKNFRQIGVGALQALTEGFKVIGEVVSNLFKGEFSEAMEAAKGFGARVATAYNEGFAEEDRKIKIENSLKDRKFQLDLEEAKGKDVRAKRIQLMKDELSILEKGSEEYNAKLIEIEKLRTEIKQEEAEKRKKIEDGNLQYFKEATERLKKLQEEAWQKEIAELTNQAATKTSLTEGEANKLLGVRKLTNEEIAKLALMSYSQQLEYIKKLATDETEIDRIKTEAKLQQMSGIANALGTLGQIAGQQTAAGKALAVAQTTIDTYVAAFRAYKEGFKIDPTGILSVINATAATVAGIASVKKIMSVQTPGGGGGGSVPSAPNMSIPRMAATGNEVSGAGAISLSSQPNNKVYVVESDIRRVQNKVEVIENNARIG